jgi:uncharacterized membrane protein (UPF0182 family)
MRQSGVQIAAPIENSFLYVVPVYLSAAGKVRISPNSSV